MFSPTGRPTLFQGERSKFDEIIAKFARLTPQETAKRRLESLEALRKTFKKLGHDVCVQEFVDASDPSVEALDNHEKVLRSPLTEAENRLSWWSNPDTIDEVEHLTQMECALRESLNAVHVWKETFGTRLSFPLDGTSQLQDTTNFHLLMGSEQERQTMAWHPPNRSQHIPFPEAPNFLPQGDIGHSGDTSVATYSHVPDSRKELELDQARQATTAILDASVLDDLNSITCLRQQLSEQYSYNPYDNPNLLEKRSDPRSEVNLKGYLMDYEIQRNFDLPRSLDSVNNSWNSAAGASAVPDFDEKSYQQKGNFRDD